jgi:hypothetical protein
LGTSYPSLGLGYDIGLGGPTFGDAALPYLTAELGPNSRLYNSPGLLASAGTLELAACLQVPLAPFSQRESRISLLHLEKRKP